MQAAASAVKGMKVFIAYQDVNNTMVPVSDNGVLLTFNSLDLAANATGALGVAVCLTTIKATEVAKIHKLEARNE